MTCDESRRLVHDYIDRRLSAFECELFERHLSECPGCRGIHRDFLEVGQLLAVRTPLPEAAGQRMLRQIRQRRHRGLRVRLGEAWDRCYTFWRDLERPVLWSKLSAVPVTAVFFGGILLQFSPADPYLSLPVVHTNGWMADHVRVHSVDIKPTRAQMNALIETAWKQPYEDSLSFVAEFTPGGGLQIENVLEYPKNLELLRAWDLALQGGRIDLSEGFPGRILISHQKIDVYEGL